MDHDGAVLNVLLGSGAWSEEAGHEGVTWKGEFPSLVPSFLFSWLPWVEHLLLCNVSLPLFLP